eukprot:GFYU01012362.1.p1 GENE.GFYU01012362.1~~GFYU01012362.1.p1  ORF type:complete len:181 (-),score=28.19 GFYU01012362.1:299-775(-)
MSNSEDNSADDVVFVALDDSEYSDYAFEYCVGNFLSHAEKLILCACCEMKGDFPAEYMSQLRTQTQGILDKYTLRCKELNVKCAIENVYCEGDPREVIVEESLNRHATLIVVGSSGRTGSKRLNIGSVAEKIVTDSQCPVFMARKPAPPLEEDDDIVF